MDLEGAAPETPTAAEALSASFPASRKRRRGFSGRSGAGAEARDGSDSSSGDSDADSDQDDTDLDSDADGDFGTGRRGSRASSRRGSKAAKGSHKHGPPKTLEERRRHRWVSGLGCGVAGCCRSPDRVSTEV